MIDDDLSDIAFTVNLIDWDDAPSGESVITIKSPTTYRGSTGGISIYEDTLQSEETLIAVHNIPAPSGQTGNDGT